jgi:hypothetical protein
MRAVRAYLTYERTGRRRTAVLQQEALLARRGNAVWARSNPRPALRTNTRHLHPVKD